MAKLVSPLMSLSASGVVGGCEYKANQYGAIVGPRSIGPWPRTRLSTRTRSMLQSISQAWSQETAETRSQWDSAAGSSMTGYSLYVQCNMFSRTYKGIPASPPGPPTSDFRRLQANWIAEPGPPFQLYVSFPSDPELRCDKVLLVAASYNKCSYFHSRQYHFSNFFPANLPFVLYSSPIPPTTIALRIDCYDPTNNRKAGSLSRIYYPGAM